MGKEKASKNCRLFFAIDLSHPLRKVLNDPISELQQIYPARWTNPEHYHVTLHFLGTFRAEHSVELVKNVQDELVSLHPFTIQFGNVELFPSKDHPRILSLSLQPNKILTQLAEGVGRAILLTGYEIEKRPFRAHLTLGRLNRSNKPVPDVTLRLPQINEFLVDRITLFQSEPEKHSSNYIPLKTIFIGNK